MENISVASGWITYKQHLNYSQGIKNQTYWPIIAQREICKIIGDHVSNYRL